MSAPYNPQTDGCGVSAKFALSGRCRLSSTLNLLNLITFVNSILIDAPKSAPNYQFEKPFANARSKTKLCHKNHQMWRSSENCARIAPSIFYVVFQSSGKPSTLLSLLLAIGFYQNRPQGSSRCYRALKDKDQRLSARLVAMYPRPSMALALRAPAAVVIVPDDG